MLDDHVLRSSYSVQSAHLSSEDTVLLCSESTAKDSWVPIGVFARLLEREVAILDTIIFYDELTTQPPAVREAVLPANGFKGNKVDILVDEESEIDVKEYGSRSPDVNAVRQDLHLMFAKQDRPCDAVENVLDSTE